MSADNYKTIWVVGTTDGIGEFLSKLANRLKEMEGFDCVARVSPTRLNVSWKYYILVELSNTELHFKIPAELAGNVAIADWNDSLQHFSEVVIEPLKEQTGGVAASLS